MAGWAWGGGPTTEAGCCCKMPCCLGRVPPALECQPVMSKLVGLPPHAPHPLQDAAQLWEGSDPQPWYFGSMDLGLSLPLRGGVGTSLLPLPMDSSDASGTCCCGEDDDIPLLTLDLGGGHACRDCAAGAATRTALKARTRQQCLPCFACLGGWRKSRCHHAAMPITNPHLLSLPAAIDVSI